MNTNAKICTYENCDKPVKTKSLCNGHYQQYWKGEPLKPLKKRGANTKWLNGFKICPGCELNKSEAEYDGNASKASGFDSHCRECTRWRAIARKYGLTRGEWEAVFEFQGSRCAACGEDDPGSARGFYVDYDPACCSEGKPCSRCIRGILCHLCDCRVDHSMNPIYAAYLARHTARGIPLVDLVKAMGLTK
ncbi:endonuclease domain-containing protein [Streptomyces sp. NPDC005134]